MPDESPTAVETDDPVTEVPGEVPDGTDAETETEEDLDTDTSAETG